MVMRRFSVMRAGSVAALLALALASMARAQAPAAAAQEMTRDAISSTIAQRFDVKVLRVTAAEQGGRKTYQVVVMRPGGNFNEAFQVTTLVADAVTGELIPQSPEPADRAVADDGGAAIRRLTFPAR
jgi:hypothetical protein